MSNKVIFNLDELFISVGIDVGADFSWMSIALPNQQFVGKPYKILHNSIDSLTTAVSKIKEAEELYSLESRIFLESTGIYHYPLFCYLRDKGFNCSVINPIITKNSTNINIRSNTGKVSRVKPQRAKNRTSSASGSARVTVRRERH